MKRTLLYLAGMLALCFAPAIAMPIENIGQSTFFSNVGQPWIDGIINSGLGLLYGPGGYALAGVGLYRLYTELQEARHTGEYAHKTILGSAGIAMVGGGPAMYHYFATKSAQAAGFVIPAVLHHLR